MSSLDNLKNEIRIINELGDISEVLEQVAAKTIIETRETILKSREYFDAAWEIYDVIRKLTDLGPDVYNKDLVVVMTPNRGMCGTLMNKVIRVGEELYKKYQADLLISGKKGHNHFANQDERTIHFFSVPNEATYEDIEPLKDIVAKYARVHIVFPRYHSISSQSVEIVSLKSVEDKRDDKAALEEKLIDSRRFIIEPNIGVVVNHVNKAIMGILFFSYFSESLLAYNAAQMIAMRDAHDNAQDELKTLNFRFNKMRREVIDSKMRDLYKFKYIIAAKS